MPHFPTILNAVVTQAFNNYNPSMYAGDGRHKGIDYGVMTGNPVYACMAGTVQVATNQQTGYGRHVRILHADFSLSIYGHLSALKVRSGDAVTEGQIIGLSGGDPRDGIDGDGLSTGPHLHWEIRPAGTHSSDQGAVDPEKWCLQYVPGTYQILECTASGGLNVRTQPNTSAPVLRTLKKRERVAIAEIKDNWARLLALRPEWCSLSYLAPTGETITIPEPDAPQPPKPELSDAEKLDRLWQAHPELH